MKKIFFIVLLLTLFSGCCPFRDNSEPAYPQNVTGWKYHMEGNVGIVGEFVLKNGESTNNGEVEIKVIDLIPAKCFPNQEAVNANRRAKLRFTRMSDSKVICEGYFNGDLCGKELNELWISDVGIRSINLKDQWVHFILTGASKK